MGDVPAERREEILAEIEEHIAELLAENPAETDADDIIPVTRFRRPTASWTDIAAVALLVLGSLMIVLLYHREWMIVAWGAATVLLWLSDVWSARDKMLVTLVLPLAAFSAIAIQGAGDEGLVYFAVILFASIWPPARLGLKLRRGNAPTM